MFDFRLINMDDGNQIIDTSLKTPYEALTPTQMIEYIEVDNQLSAMELLEKKNKRIQQEQGFFRKIACACGML